MLTPLAPREDTGRALRGRVQRQLVVMAAGGAVLVVVLALVSSWGRLATGERERELVAVSTAQRLAFDMDAAHEQLNAAFVRAQQWRAATRDPEAASEIRTAVGEAVDRLVTDQRALSDLRLGPREQHQADEVHSSAERWLATTRGAITRLLLGSAVHGEQLTTLDRAHATFDEELTDYRDLLSHSAEAAVKANSRARALSGGVIWATVATALALTVLMFVAIRRSVLGVTGQLQRLITSNENDAARGEFGRQVVEAFDMADDEEAARSVVARAMTEVSTAMPMELLLADSSKAHLSRAAEHQAQGAPCCPVATPFECVAVRRGTAVTFEDSEELHACPKLRGRATGPVSAACVPITFMGRAIGVLHATGEQGSAPEQETVERLSRLAAHTGSRIGTLRATRQTQMQAATDSLTGLVNRRTLDHEVRELLAGGQEFALAFGDLDRFKSLNDTYGHDAGDRALRLFAKVAREATRSEDIVARYGGEEFVILLPGRGASDAVEAMQRVRTRLSEAVRSSDVPTFTVSFGVTDSSMGTTVTDLVRSADVALMEAKSNGRDQVVLAGSSTVQVSVPAQGGPVGESEPAAR